MHEGIQYDLITRSRLRSQALNSLKSWLFDICPSFLCHVTLNLAETSVVTSLPSVPHEANLLFHTTWPIGNILN